MPITGAVGYGEAQQEKRMLLLDESFQVLQSLPLSCGRRHHSLLWRSGTLMHADGHPTATPTATPTGTGAASDTDQRVAACICSVRCVVSKPARTYIYDYAWCPSNQAFLLQWQDILYVCVYSLAVTP